MTDTNKELAQVAQKLNNISSSSGGARFSGLKKVADGQYEMLVHLDPNNSNHNLLFSSPEQVKRLVRTREVAPNSWLSRMNARARAEDLEQRIYTAGLKDILRVAEQTKDPKKIEAVTKEVALLNQRFRDVLTPSTLDLRQKTADEAKALELYDRSEREYLKTGIYGTTLDLLSNFAATGFHNEISDLDIKDFYDSWVSDLNFTNTVTIIFHNLFKYSVAYVLPAIGKYEQHMDGISSIPGKEPSRGSEKAKLAYAFNKVMKKYNMKLDYNRFSQIFDQNYKEVAQLEGMPVGYTVLDPKYVNVESSGLFGGRTITVTKPGLKDIKKAYERAEKSEASKREKELLKLLPSKIRQAVDKDEDYVDLESIITPIYLRKNDFESYAKPKGARAFDSFDYKEELKKADFATLDGVFNYILKVTVGDKDNPVTDLATLDSLAEAFNTPQKAITVVWNHTLGIEKITSQEVGDILGKTKYEPVNEDITAALGIARALIDGENTTASAGVLTSKAVQSEINAARKQVEVWIYQQYRQIAKANNFNYFPAVRWAQAVITTDGDAVTRASWMQLVDRLLVSRQTAQKALGLDPRAEMERLKAEIKEGIGIEGSPYQQSPSGDQGRPKGQPTSTKKPVDDVKTTKRKTTPSSPSQQDTQASEISVENITQYIESLDDKEKYGLLKELEAAAVKEGK